MAAIIGAPVGVLGACGVAVLFQQHTEIAGRPSVTVPIGATKRVLGAGAIPFV